VYHCYRKAVKLRRFILFLAFACCFSFVARAQTRLAAPKSTPEKRRTFAAPVVVIAPTALPPEIVESLARDGFWIAPVLRATVDAQAMGDVLRATESSAKVAVIEALPKNQSANAAARELAQQLKTDELVIVVSDRPRAIGLHGVLDTKMLGEIGASSARTFDSGGTVAGVAQLLRLVNYEGARRAARLRMNWILGIGIPLILFVWFARRARKMRLADLQQSRAAAEDLRARLETETEKWQSDVEYALIAEADTTRRDALKAARTRAEAACDEAQRKFKTAQTAAEYERAQLAFRAASTEVQQARSLLDLRPLETSTQIVRHEEVENS